jgi:mono/diheme cytochrome c family protein
MLARTPGMEHRMRRAAILAATAAAALGGAPALAGPYADYGGRELYQRFCASCHGSSGFGDGPVADSLEVVVPDLTRMYQRSGGSFPEERVRRIVDGRQVYPVHGTRHMPVWGQELWVEQGASPAAEAEVRGMVDRLVAYLRSIQQAGAGDGQ